jgi:hypothetical protein
MIIEYALYIALMAFIWWLSAWIHEGDLIEARKAGKTPELFYEGYAIECKVKDY